MLLGVGERMSSHLNPPRKQEKAEEWLRAKGLSSAGKKADRQTSEGLISTYVHTGSRLGVMVEVNCETDFVSKGDKFAELAKAVAMQLAASPTVEFVTSNGAMGVWCGAVALGRSSGC